MFCVYIVICGFKLLDSCRGILFNSIILHLHGYLLKMQDVRSRRYICKTLSKPVIVGYMSVDVSRNYHSDLTQLRFLNTTDIKRTSLDLNHNINSAVKRSTHDNEEKIDLLLKFLQDKHHHLFPQFQADFITYRRTLIKTMCAAFGVSEPITIRASLFKGNIYLCYMESAQEVSRNKFCSEQEKKFCAWGYKFEQYLTSDKPNCYPDVQKPVIENEEFSLYYYAELGGHKLLYGAEIDALLTGNSTTEIPNTKDFETNLKYLQSNNYAELKTNREIHDYRQERNFKRYKLLYCWCQCYLANLSGLYMGYRNDDGIIQRLQWFDTQEIVSYCKHVWTPQYALDFLDNFLTYVKHSFQPYQTHLGPVSLEFQINMDKTISVSDNCPNDVLPPWYIQEVQ